jgi:hypothetical protein
MKTLLAPSLLALLCVPVHAADLVLTRKTHADAYSLAGRDVPAKDGTETVWMGKDRMRMDDGEQITIVRLDLKKAWFLDPATKVASAIDLPFDMKKYMPAEMAPMMEQMMASLKPTVTATEETKKFGIWNARKYTLTMGGPANATTTIWASKDVDVSAADYKGLMGVTMSTMPGGAAIAAEMQKIEGATVYEERVQKVMGATMRTTSELTGVERKDPAEGWYDLPKGYTEKPFDLMGEAIKGHGAPGGAGKPKPAGG